MTGETSPATFIVQEKHRENRELVQEDLTTTACAKSKRETLFKLIYVLKDITAGRPNTILGTLWTLYKLAQEHWAIAL